MLLVFLDEAVMILLERVQLLLQIKNLLSVVVLHLFLYKKNLEQLRDYVYGPPLLAGCL